MKKIESFGIIAFKESLQVKNVLARILIWSRQQNVSVLFHPFVKNQVDDDAPICESECSISRQE